MPYTPFHNAGNSSEVGALTTTAPLEPTVVGGSDGPMRDFTFFYNPISFYPVADSTTYSDLAVWARESW